MEFLFSIDKSLFIFINQTLSNPVGDALWPFITDYVQFWPVRVILLALWIWLIIRGGRKGRTVALMLIPLIFLSDKLSSAWLKDLVGRPRPCTEVDGVRAIQVIHLLVDCGPGKSFPSSHAVNNFAMATLFSYYYRKWTWAFVAWASLVALSRPAVGVHYPSDILGGALIGAAIAAFMIWTWLNLERRWLPPDNSQPVRK